jgi:hypothetical protein
MKIHAKIILNESNISSMRRAFSNGIVLLIMSEKKKENS